MEYITRQCQGDFAVLDQRENNLWMDAGIATSQADWSLDFDIGMNFMEWHGPVPLAHEIGVFDRALKFLLNLQQGKPVRRRVSIDAPLRRKTLATRFICALSCKRFGGCLVQTRCCSRFAPIS
jgi:hypothetical protein